MSDHSDLVARLRNAAESSEQFLDGRADILREAADALDVKPGANADLIAEARNGPPSCDRDCCDMHPNDRSCVDCKSRWANQMVERLADALEAADSQARVLPTREQIAKTISMAEERALYPDGLPTDEEGPLECHYEAADDVLALLTGGKADG